MIKPTIGRVVWYQPNGTEGYNGPLAAIVCHVHSDTMVNLAVLDPNGNPLSRTSVVLVQDDDGRPVGPYAEWMPYQKAAAGQQQPTLHAK